jgi:hypothetical protein
VTAYPLTVSPDRPLAAQPATAPMTSSVTRASTAQPSGPLARVILVPMVGHPFRKRVARESESCGGRDRHDPFGGPGAPGEFPSHPRLEPVPVLVPVPYIN